MIGILSITLKETRNWKLKKWSISKHVHCTSTVMSYNGVIGRCLYVVYYPYLELCFLKILRLLITTHQKCVITVKKKHLFSVRPHSTKMPFVSFAHGEKIYSVHVCVPHRKIVSRCRMQIAKFVWSKSIIALIGSWTSIIILFFYAETLLRTCPIISYYIFCVRWFPILLRNFS